VGEKFANALAAPFPSEEGVPVFFVTLFVISVVFCTYTLVGYPLLLALLAWWKPRPIQKARLHKNVSIILPVRNGERWIRAKLQSILALRYPREMMEILVVSDGSTDATDSIVQEFVRRNSVQLIHIPKQGKATALNAGLDRACGEIVFFTDVRQELSPDSLANLVGCFADPSVGVVSGELIIRPGDSREELSVGLYWQYEKWIRKRLSRLDSVLGATGCIYAMRRELAGRLPADTLADDMHLPLGAFFRGYRVLLDDSAKAYDFPTAIASEFRRKVRTLAGVYQVISRYPALLGPSNRMWLHFVSHKLARLLLPFALIAVAVCAFALPAPWNAIVLGPQALFYGIAVLDRWVPGPWSIKRFTAPVHTFAALVVAALLASSVLFIPSRRFWKDTNVSVASGTR
jgi:cellulose synthase/poly-beta-1,6-N-acetylglucosamine synthase-like glycosyltransferase